MMIKAGHSGFNPVYAEDAPTLEELSRLSESNDDVILEFGAPWCEHCQAAEPVVRQILEENNIPLHIKVYDGKGKLLGRQFQVKLWPTLILLRNGQEVRRIVRPVTADQVQQLLMDSNT